MVRGLKKYSWIMKQLGEVCPGDARPIVELVRNDDLSHIEQTLSLMEEYGPLSGEIGRRLVLCRNWMEFSARQAELFLFVHLRMKVGESAVPLTPAAARKAPDFSIKVNDRALLIEVFTPVDFFGFQLYDRSLTGIIEKVPVTKGYKITASESAENPFYPLEFPNEVVVNRWLEDFDNRMEQWLASANEGDSLKVSGPGSAMTISFQLDRVYDDRNRREVIKSCAGRSTDTRQYFELDNPETAAKTEWGKKIRNKLKDRQAGNAANNTLRILAVNFSGAETRDSTFLKVAKYHGNLERMVRHIAQGIQPFPTYDVVLPCDLGHTCGFAEPIILSQHTKEEIKELFSKTGFDEPIPDVPVASKEETEAFWKAILSINYAREWAEALEKSQDELARLADEAVEEFRRGQTQLLSFND